MARPFRTFSKDASESVTYTIRWSAVLAGAGTGVTLSGVAWSVESGDVTLGATVLASPDSAVRVSGGTAGTTSRVTAFATLSNGETRERTIAIRVES